MPGLLSSLRTGRAAAIVALVLAAGLFATFQNRHVLVAPQGKQALLAARSLSEDGSLSLQGGRPYVRYGPLYPVLLAAGKTVGLAPLPSVVLVNAITWAFGLLLFFRLALRVSGTGAGRATILFAALATHAYYFRMARPDALTPLAALGTFLALDSYSRGRSLRWLILAALACALGACARYLSVVTLTPVAIGAVIWIARREGRDAVLHPVLFTFLSLAPITAWLLRNRLLTGFFTGMSRTAPREHSIDLGWLGNLAATGKTIALDVFDFRALGVRSVLYEGDAASGGTWTILRAVLVLILLVAIAYRGRARPVPRDPGSRRLTVWIAIHAAAHLLALVTLWTAANNDPIHTRYVAPMYGPLLLVGLAIGSGVGRPALPGFRVLLAIAFALILIPGLGKSRELLGESPGKAVLKKTLWTPDDLWIRELTWGAVDAHLTERDRSE